MISSRAAMVPTWAMASRSPATGIAHSSSSWFTRSAALAIPDRSASGFAPAATLRSPSATMAWVSTVAVVVPSPATSLVLVAAVLASWAPRFSAASSSSMSRAMVTPSFVMFGPPNFLSSTTYRPRGPRVTLTASASLSTPRCSAERASVSKRICFAMDVVLVSRGGNRGPSGVDQWCTERRWTALDSAGQHRAPAARGCGPPGRGCPELRASPAPASPPQSASQATGPVTEQLLGDLGQHVTGRQEQVLLAAVLDFGAAVLRVDDDITFDDVDRDPFAVVVITSRTDGQDGALLGLLLGGVRNDDARRGRRLGLIGLDEDLVLERLDVHARHGVTSPFLGLTGLAGLGRRLPTV